MAARADDGWTAYRAATAAAEASAWAGALPLYRQALAEATDPALRQAACYGIGVTTRALVEGGAPEAQALACEGERAYTCFLGLAPAEPEAVTLAEEGRTALAARCRPPAPPRDPTSSQILAGAGVLALGGGGVLVGFAFDNAAEVRARGRVDTADLEDRAELELGLGYGLLGAGAALLGLALWTWPDTATALRPTPGGWALGGSF